MAISKFRYYAYTLALACGIAVSVAMLSLWILIALNGWYVLLDINHFGEGWFEIIMFFAIFAILVSCFPKINAILEKEVEK